MGAPTTGIRRAVVDTVQRWDIPIEHFEAFLQSMTMDLTVTDYATWDDLSDYIYGSAAVIGLQLVPILEPLHEDAFRARRSSASPSSWPTSVRDVDEDLDRGRLYLPLADLDRFGLTRADLERRVVDERVRDLLRFQIARVRRFERIEPGRSRTVAPDESPVRRGRAHPLLRDRRRDRAQRLSGLHAPGRGPCLTSAGGRFPAWLRAVRARRA